jgi:hypothetical protein
MFTAALSPALLARWRENPSVKALNASNGTPSARSPAAHQRELLRSESPECA